MAVTGTQTYTTTYTYDANGNLIRKSTSKGAERYDYNGFNQLTILKQGTTATGYAYNASGIRTAKHTENTDTYFLLDGGDVVAEYTDGEMTAHYVRGINLIRGKFGSNVRYYLFNAHGDVTVLTDGNGTLKKSYDYDAFGNEEKPSSSDTNPFRYCGEYFDKETKTYYLRARYYDPAIGRFTQQDTHWSPANAIYGDNPRKIYEGQDALGLSTYAYAPEISAIMQSGNLYVYCVNNPCMYQDYTGEVLGLILVGALIGAVTSAVIDVVTQRLDGTEWNDIDPASVGISAISGAFSGALAASGAGVLVQIVGNAVISGATEIAMGQFTEDDASLSSVLISAGFGAFAGALGGNGLQHYTQTVKVIGYRLVGGVNGFGVQSFAYQSSRLAQLFGRELFKGTAKGFLPDAFLSLLEEYSVELFSKGTTQ